MTSRPPRICRHPGCNRLTTETYCPQHRPKQAPRKRSAAWHSWYSKAIWTDDLRPNQLLDEPFCRICGAPATDVDHIVDHKGDWALFTDRSNLESLCHSCHSAKTMRDEHKNRKKQR